MARLRIGITGGAGYIGSKLADRLSKTYEIVILDIKEPNSIPHGCLFQRCDVRDYDSVFHSLKKIDLAIHTAVIQIPQITEQKAMAYEVNILGTENVCKAVGESAHLKGMILASSWHTVGEHGMDGTIDESFGYRPDKVEPRARLYALSKMAQESIVRFYDESFDKTYAIIRMGTVLGHDMPASTAASTFIDKALQGSPLTPFKHSMYRPMFFVDIDDVAEAYYAFSKGILNDEIPRSSDSFMHIVNFFLPKPVTVLDLATIVAESVHDLTNHALSPQIEVVDKGVVPVFTIEDSKRVHGNSMKSLKLLRVEPTISVRGSIDKVVRKRLGST